MRRKWGGIVFGLIAFVLAGAVVGLLVVWVPPELSWLWRKVSSRAPGSAPVRAREAEIAYSFEGRRVLVLHKGDTGADIWTARWEPPSDPYEEPTEFAGGEWQSLPAFVQPPPDQVAATTMTYAYGLPWRSLAQYTDITSAGGSIAIVARGSVSWDDRHALIPITPIWGGVALNSMFYAGLLWGAWEGIRRMRRWVRRRRGVCVGCGYQRVGTGTPCPECGRVGQ